MDKYKPTHRGRQIGIVAWRFPGNKAISKQTCQIPEWFIKACMELDRVTELGDSEYFHIMTPSGKALVSPGDYLIYNGEKDIYPCNEQTFNNKYEPLVKDET